MTRGLFVLVCLLCCSSLARAHPTPGSVALIDFTVAGARIEQDVPIEELERALARPLAAQGESAQHMVERHAAELLRYAAQHVRATAADSSEPWAVEMLDVVGHAADDGPRARFRFALVAPQAEASRSIVLHDSVVAHAVVSHYTHVYVRSDWALGRMHAQPQLAGTIHAGRNDVTIVRGGSFWRGLRSSILLGMEHIATGTDHLMFLFALLLVAPVAAIGSRWSGRRSSAAAGSVLAKTVTAFTLGHSLTLALGAFGWIRLPTAPVEVAITLSVLIAALHAMRPLFPRRELMLTAAFGLVHGLAFASTLSGRDLGRAQILWTLLGFNLGIELAQLALLGLVVPWVLLLSHTRSYAAFRTLAASCAAVLSLGWLIERTSSFTNPIFALQTWIEAHPLQLLCAFASSALIARVCDREHLEISRVAQKTPDFARDLRT